MVNVSNQKKTFLDIDISFKKSYENLLVIFSLLRFFYHIARWQVYIFCCICLKERLSYIKKSTICVYINIVNRHDINRELIISNIIIKQVNRHIRKRELYHIIS